MKTFCASIISGFFVLIVSGCVTNQPLPPGVHTEAKSSGGVKVLSVGLLPDEGGLLIHGMVERQIGYAGSSDYHLDLKVIGPAGNVVSHQAINFFPNPIPFSRFSPGRSSYTARLQEIPSPGSTILVAVDCFRCSDCKLVNGVQ